MYHIDLVRRTHMR